MLLLLLGCRGGPDSATPADTAVAVSPPAPWESLSAVPLSAFRPLMTTALEDTLRPDRLLPITGRGITAIRNGPEVLVLDPLYHHSGARHCVSASEWPDWGHADRQGSCAEGEVEIQRGRLIPDAPAVAVAVDEAALTITVLTEAGTLQTASADLLGDNPLDFLRLSEPEDTGLGALSEALLASEDGAVAVAVGDTLHHSDTTTALPGAALDLAFVDGAPWVLTDGGLWADGAKIAAAGSRMAVGAAAVWLGGAGTVTRIDRTTLAAEAIAVSGATGPLAVDGERVYAATDDGIAVLEDGAEVARHAQDAPTDIALGPPHEILVLTGSEVAVILDETALVGESGAGEDVLDVVMTAFIEQPRNERFDADCRGEGETVTGYAEQALANGALLDDLPFPPTVGITPFFAQRAADCDLIDTLAPLIDRIEPGVLFHNATPACDEDCLVAWLAEDAAAVAALGAAPTWASGLAAKDDLDDFADLLRQAGGPDRYLFFGVSALPGVNHEADPRSKNSWPVQTGQRSAAWRIDHADELEEGSPGGWLSVYPGDNIPLFNLGGCPNLLLRECHQLGQGGLLAIDADDTTALTLLLHRALADRSGTATFSFHLPDLSHYDYTADCTVTDRVWSGEDCQGAVLQEWAMGVYARHVLGGLVRLSAPSQLPSP